MDARVFRAALAAMTADLQRQETPTVDVVWTRAGKFTGWHGRSGNLSAPIFRVELDSTGTRWTLRSTLPGYASSSWSFAFVPSTSSKPPADVQEFAANVAKSFMARVLGHDVGALDVADVAGRAYEGGAPRSCVR